MLNFMPTGSLASSITSRFQQPDDNSDIPWWREAPPEIYYLMIVRITKEAVNNVIDCQFLDPADATLCKDKAGVTATVSIDLSDLRQAWRALPSTVDKDPGGGPCAVLGVNAKWFDNLRNEGKVVPKQPSLFFKYPYGYDMETARMLQNLLYRALREGAGGLSPLERALLGNR
jgi:hypothetical protein